METKQYIMKFMPLYLPVYLCLIKMKCKKSKLQFKRGFNGH